MSETAFIITIDTEGDNLWSQPRVITTHNARFLPRFQSLCERFGFRPVYLANYEMAICDAFVEFGRDVIARRAGEIGMHLHAWNSPPLLPLTDDDFRHQPYLIEYPDAVMKEKITLMTQLLQERFGQPIASHRAGRFGFDGRYAASLLEQGYRVDCSVTLGIVWIATPGAPGGAGRARARGASCFELMLHSSELMPGGSPTFRTAAAVERLYADLEALFEDLSAWCAGLTLREFHTRMTTEAAA